MNGDGKVLAFDEKTGIVNVAFKTGKIALKIPESFLSGFIVFDDPMMQLHIEEIVEEYQIKLLEKEEKRLNVEKSQHYKDKSAVGDVIVNVNSENSRWSFDIPAEWPTESKFRACGYSVAQNSGLTTYERQNILRDMIHEGKSSINETIKFLQRNIDLRYKNPNLKLACSKWKEDIEFVNKHFKNV